MGRRRGEVLACLTYCTPSFPSPLSFPSHLPSPPLSPFFPSLFLPSPLPSFPSSLPNHSSTSSLDLRLRIMVTLRPFCVSSMSPLFYVSCRLKQNNNDDDNDDDRDLRVWTLPASLCFFFYFILFIYFFFLLLLLYFILFLHFVL